MAESGSDLDAWAPVAPARPRETQAGMAVLWVWSRAQGNPAAEAGGGGQPPSDLEEAGSLGKQLKCWMATNPTVAGGPGDPGDPASSTCATAVLMQRFGDPGRGMSLSPHDPEETGSPAGQATRARGGGHRTLL